MNYRFSLFTLIMTIVVLLLGNLVVATEAGDACGSDWPRCNGSLIPDFHDPLVVIEYTHRLFTGALGFIILINGVVAMRQRKAFPQEKAVKYLVPASVILLLTQAVVGGVNVLLKTPPGFTTLDVMVSMWLLLSLVFLTVALKRRPIHDWTERIAREREAYQAILSPSLLTLACLYLEVMLGAFFKHSAASEVMMGIDISERLLHSLSLSQTIYNIHGMVSFLVLVGAIKVLFVSRKKRILTRASLLLVLLTGSEMLAGFALVSLQLPTALSSTHMILAIFTLVVAAYIVAKAMLKDHLRSKTAEKKTVERALHA
ncbi:hypothetical protein BSNK01_30980 [Bacillaceae bacterium]